MTVPATDLYFPPPAPRRWETVSPTSAGWSRDGLDEVARYCELQNCHQLVILHRGRILFERYWSDSGPTITVDIASVQKSFLCLMLGILQGDRAFSLDDPVSRWLGRGWSRASPADEDRILLSHVTSMTSGLYDDFTVEAPPGTIWYYNNNAYHQLRKVVERVTEGSTQDAFARLLGGPLGLESAHWTPRPGMTDPNGWTLAGLRASARDLARLGLCVLAGGQWMTDSIVAEQFLQYVLRPSQGRNPSYGHLWWLPTRPSAILPGGPVANRRKAFGGYRLDRPIIPSAPADLVAAFGAGEKRLYISRALGVVVVRLGPATSHQPSDPDSDEGLWQRLTAAATGPERCSGHPDRVATW